MGDPPRELVEFHRINRGLTRQVARISVSCIQDIMERSGLPFMTLHLPFSVPYAEMFAEASALKSMFVRHRSNQVGWRSICLHGLSSVHTENHHRYGYLDVEKAPYAWTDICKFCPVTWRFFRDLFGYSRYQRVRFMLLEAGGYILPHSDTLPGYLSAVNIALNNPHGCEFVMKDVGIVPFAPGTANILALGNPHVVWNQSDEDRIHIIVHGQRDTQAHWNDTLFRSYERCFAS